MGDAGVNPPGNLHTSPELREIHVLVTGFGPFKGFVNNPSWLIASSLPLELSSSAFIDSSRPAAAAVPPQSRTRTWASQVSGPPHPLRKPDERPYKIIIHTYPEPVRVAYASTSVLIPALLDPSTNAPFSRAFDYVLHIGLASGRNSYTLETNAHRDHYEIPDVDDDIGTVPGETKWRHAGIPEQLWVGWNLQDVETRWNENVRHAEKERQQMNTKVEGPAELSDPSRQLMPWKPRWSPGNTHTALLPGMLISPATTSTSTSTNTNAYSTAAGSPHRDGQDRAVVRLSGDAGRFLCEFILMSTLTYLWQTAYRQPANSTSTLVPATTTADDPTSNNKSTASTDPREKIGKAAFLHVPNGTSPTDIARGRLVAENVIRALVASWEAGYRNPNVYTATDVVADQASPGVLEGVVTVGGFEAQGTGDS